MPQGMKLGNPLRLPLGWNSRNELSLVAGVDEEYRWASK